MKLSELLDKHIRQNQGRLKRRTIGHTIIAFDKLIDCLGDVDCEQVTRDSGKEFQAYLSETVGPNSVNSYLRSVSPVFTTGVDSELLEHNPFNRLPKFKKAKRIHHIYTDEEVVRMIEHTDYFLQVKILAALTAGMRRGECHWLTWDMINLDAKTIRLKGQDRTDTILGWQPKDYENRILPLEPQLAQWLRPTNTPYVTLPETVVKRLLKLPPDRVEAEMANVEAAMTRKFARLTQRLQIDGTFHDLRATAITRWIKAGLNPADVQYLAGHSNIETTMGYFELVESEATEASRGKIGVAGLAPATFRPPAGRSNCTELHSVGRGVA